MTFQLQVCSIWRTSWKSKLLSSDTTVKVVGRGAVHLSRLTAALYFADCSCASMRCMPHQLAEFEQPAANDRAPTQQVESHAVLTHQRGWNLRLSPGIALSALSQLHPHLLSVH
ncbi:hypothetical protein GOP47_0006886 [Adiantum capillus-veneris]|uniref:Uncharacterized protein n=1 Tax=Adiantum capillus-veneris TaxID=13818 RepID=A0A9D4V3R4_ADICA|nr:hypothetical protein GOP47_0006886 [Adiantum capillus-veneris]